MAQRGLQPKPAAASAQPAPGETGDEFVALAEFEEPGQALQVQASLSAVQIPALFLSERGLSWEPRRSMGQTLFVLAVPKPLYELAQEALDTELSEEDLEAQALAAGAPPEDAEPEENV
jgi:hypothetical protein